MLHLSRCKLLITNIWSTGFQPVERNIIIRYPFLQVENLCSNKYSKENIGNFKPTQYQFSRFSSCDLVGILHFWFIGNAECQPARRMVRLIFNRQISACFCVWRIDTANYSWLFFKFTMDNPDNYTCSNCCR